MMTNWITDIHLISHRTAQMGRPHYRSVSEIKIFSRKRKTLSDEHFLPKDRETQMDTE